MSAPRRLPETDDTVFMVAQWKDDLDPSAKWWRRAFYRFLYRPFNEIALKVFKIPPFTNVVIDGSKVRFERFEPQGFFGSEHEADLACLGERWSYKDYTYGRLMPPQGGQVGKGPVFPRAKNPGKRVAPIFEFIIKDRRQDNKERKALAECLQQMNKDLSQVLDR